MTTLHVGLYVSEAWLVCSVRKTSLIDSDNKTPIWTRSQPPLQNVKHPLWLLTKKRNTVQNL